MNKKRTRSRDDVGRYVGDDKNTPVINEAYKYSKWERFKWRWLFVHPDTKLSTEIKNFIKWVFNVR
jgi:hypothetical protein